MTPTCPTCHNTGKKVKRITLDSLLRSERRSNIADDQYYVCTSPNCLTVYYDGNGKSSFGKSDLTVRFGLKEAESPRPVCYCFDHSVEEIEEEIRTTGQSTVVESIKVDMEGPGCRCECTNPLGICCLKAVQEAVAEGFRLAGREKDAVNVGEVDHADCCQTGESSAPASSHGNRAGAMAAGGSVLAAILSSACCWLPLLLITFGASAAGVAGFFEAYRPFFIAGAIGLLSLGFYMVYFRREKCEPGSACATPNRKLHRLNQAMLWPATILVGAFVFFPNYVGSLLGTPPTANAGLTDAGLETEVYHIEGMTCQGCADILSGELTDVPNVKSVKVDYDNKSAVLCYDPAKPVSPKQVLAAVEAAGYSATLSRNTQAAPTDQEGHSKTPE